MPAEDKPAMNAAPMASPRTPCMAARQPVAMALSSVINTPGPGLDTVKTTMTTNIQ
jgi:hypothetical protein